MHRCRWKAPCPRWTAPPAGQPTADGPAAARQVVLVDFWTYSCINCLRAMPFVHEWERRYRDHGLVVIAAYTRRSSLFERNPRNVMKAVSS